MRQAVPGVGGFPAGTLYTDPPLPPAPLSPVSKGRDPMADLGDTSGANSSSVAGGPGHKKSSWVVVVLISVASIVLGFAFVLENIPLAVVGGVIGLVGVVLGFTSGIMDDAH